jgi:hypothetical protein
MPHLVASPTPFETAILQAVAYASVFEYPLTIDEVQRTLVEYRASVAEVQRLCRSSAWLQERLEFRSGFVFPVGCARLVDQRRSREAASRALLAGQRGILRMLCLLPFVRLLAISGSLAHLNAGHGADLDLFIVTRGRRVWSVTLAIVLLSKVLGRRRTICANFVMSDARLAIEQQDLFAANQVIHLKPLVGADLCAAFASANPFVTTWYPTFEGWSELPLAVRPGPALSGVKRVAEWLLAVPSLGVEWISRRVYGWYLRRQVGRWRSPEQVRLDADYVKLHTRSHRASVLDRFDDVLAHMGESDAEAARARVAV